MLTAAEVTVQAMAFILQVVPLGTNIGLMRVLWVMVNGSLLQSRGAVCAARHLSRFSVVEIRHSWAAMRYGGWEINELLEAWQVYVASQNQWRARRYERYQVLSVDITGFWRPHLQRWCGKHYHNLAQKALPAVVVGVMIISGQVGSQRIPLLKRLVRCQPTKGKAEFRGQLLKAAVASATEKTVIVVDAEFGLNELQTSGVAHFVVRLASNITARRKQKPVYQGKGRPPKYGEKVRPSPGSGKTVKLPPQHLTSKVTSTIRDAVSKSVIGTIWSVPIPPLPRRHRAFPSMFMMTRTTSSLWSWQPICV